MKQLLEDPKSEVWHLSCTFCKKIVVDYSDVTMKEEEDSRQKLAKFDDQVKILLDLAMKVENVK